MKAKIEQINRYKVTIGDKTWEDFKKCEEWEGMLKFSGPSGTLIVDSDESGFNSVFASLFGQQSNEDPVDLTIIKVTPGMIPAEGT